MRVRSLVGASALMAVVGTASADILFTDHNFSTYGWTDEVCLPCHIPHHASSPVFPAGESGPLWNHAIPADTQVYTLFDGSTAVRNDALDGRSILCMGCHDGTVALDSFGGRTGNNYIDAGGLIGTDLQDDHPVGATGVYPLGVSYMNQDWTVHTDDNGTPVYWGANAKHGMKLQGMIDPSGATTDVVPVVSCTSCHEPHGRGGNENMLWFDNTGSTLCLFCHHK